MEAQSSEEILVSDLIELIVPCLSEDLFTLKKNYTVAVSVEHSQGKWPETLGNSFFIDSQWLLPDLLEMLQQRFEVLATTHS